MSMSLLVALICEECFVVAAGCRFEWPLNGVAANGASMPGALF